MKGELEILGFKFRPVIVILCMLVGASMGVLSICSCSKLILQDLQEGFGSMMAVPPSNVLPRKKTLGTPDKLFFYADTEFKPECCESSSVGSSSGCACVTSEQIAFINSRGGNRSDKGLY